MSERETVNVCYCCLFSHSRIVTKQSTSALKSFFLIELTLQSVD